MAFCMTPCVLAALNRRLVSVPLTFHDETVTLMDDRHSMLYDFGDSKAMVGKF